ncbi:uncharacterized protein LOC117475740 isoform X8 [Trematomus bernacchii]|uniref:uncharacterized protein LOC117475740 isoform X8 n=1 Tax=Trematomus bernacchii TaxID=40690 RepID=UPI001469E62A|nr:uncharacterized protein LOC117475740 isoform X8 [Trematomus bernacchii]
MTYSQTEETIIQYGTLEEILEQGLAYGRHDSVGHNDCQPLLGPVSDPNPKSLDPLTMQTDRSRQQDPQVPESEEMSSSPPTEPEPSSPQREEDQHLEDHPGATDSNSMTSTTANISQSQSERYSIYLELLNVLLDNILIPNHNLNRRQRSLTLAYNKHYMDNIEQQINVPDKKLLKEFIHRPTYKKTYKKTCKKTYKKTYK